MAYVTWPNFQLLGTPNISGPAEGTNLKFCVQIDVRDTKPKMKKWPEGGMALVTWPTFQIFGPPIISGMAEDTNLKFGMPIDRKGY